jgi:glutamate-1-semialdehyde 2,1-aminomutase
MAAGAATLQRLCDGGVYADLDARAARLASGLARAAQGAGASVSVVRDGSMLTVFFTPVAPTNFAEAGAADVNRFARFFRTMLEHGVLLPPSQFEAWFVSAAHGDAEIAATIVAAQAAFAAAA